MSEIITDGVVQLSFDNKDFEKGVATSLKSLDKLDKELKLKDGSKGLENVARAARDVDLSQLQNSVDELNKKFSMTGVAARTVVSELTKKGMAAVGKAIDGVTGKIGWLNNKMVEGGSTRAKNIAQAKFQLKGLGIAWEDVADDIDYAVSGTRYGLDSAAKAAAQLSASQVQAGDDMKAALRGISGVAAMTNSEYDDIAQIFTTVAGNGRLMTDQLNQMSYRGINAAASLADAFNDSEEMSKWFYESYTAHAKKNDEAISESCKITEANIRTLVTNGGLDFDHFAAAMDSAFGEHAKEADNTFSGAMANVGAAMAKIGAEFAGPFYNNTIVIFNRLKKIINDFRGVFQPVIDAVNEFEFVISMKIEGLLRKIEKLLGGENNPLSGIFKGVGNFIHGITEAIGGEELKVLDQVKALGGESMKTADAIEKAQEALRLMRSSEDNDKVPLTMEQAIAKVMATTQAATTATNDYASELKNLAQSIGQVDKSVDEGGYTGWDNLTAKIQEAGGSVEDYEEIVKRIAKEHGENIDGLLEDYGDGIKALFATGELPVEIATEAMDEYTASIERAVNATESLKGSSGGFTKTAEEMHDAIQSIWSEKEGKSWEERERILTEQGFSKAEIDEIHAVVNEMQASGRTLSSDIDTVYQEIDGTIDKSVNYNEQQLKKFARDEEHYVGQAASYAKDGSKSTANTVLDIFGTIKSNVIGVVGSIGQAFSNVFLSDKKKPIEQMTTLEKVFSGVFNVIKVGGKGAWAGLSTLGNQISNLWGKFKETPLFSYLSDKVNGLIESMNNLSWEGIQEKFEKFKNKVTSNPVWTTVQDGFKRVQDFFDKHFDVSRVTEAFKGISFESIKENFTNTIEQIKTDGLFETIKTKWQEFKAWIKQANPFVGITDWFNNLDGESIAGKVKNAVDTIKQSIHDLFFGTEAEAAETGGKSATETKLTKLGETAENTGTFFDKVREVVGSAAPHIKKVWDSVIQPIFSGLNGMDILKGGKIIAIIGVLRQLKKNLKGFEGLGKSVTGITDSVSGSVGSFGSIGSSIAGFIKDYGKSMSDLDKAQTREANTAAIKNIAITIGILAGALVILANVPLKNLKQAVIILGAVTAAVIALSVAAAAFMKAKAKLQEATSIGDKSKGILAPLREGFTQIGEGVKEFGKGVKIAAIAAMILAVVAAIFALYFAIKLYAGMDQETFVQGGYKVALVLGAITLAMTIMAKACKGAGLGLLGVAPAIIAVTVALAAMAGVIKLYSLMSWETFEKGGKMAAAVLAAITAAIVIMGLALKKAKPTAMLSAAVVIVALTASLVVLTGAIIALSLIPTKNLIKGGVALAAVLIGITAAISIMGKALKDTSARTLLGASVAIMALSAAIIVITLALVGLSFVPTSNLIKSVVALGVVLTVLKNFAREAAKMQGTATALLSMSLLIGVVAISLTKLSEIKTADLVGPTVAMSAILLFLKGFAKSMNGIASSQSVGKSVLGVVSMIGVLIAVAGTLYLLGKYGDVEKYGKIAMSIVGTLVGLSVSLRLLGSLPPTAGISAAAVVLGFVGVFAGLGMLLAGLDRIKIGGESGRITQLLEDSGDMLEKIGEVIGKFVGGIAAGALKAIDTVDQSAIDKVVGFVRDIAGIEIPTQYEFKWDSEGISFVDKSLLSFSRGMKGICEAVSSLTVPETDEDLERKSQYFGKIAGFVTQLAGISIPVQTEFKWDSEGISYVDTSLTSFAQGMNGVVNAVNALATPPDEASLNTKQTLMTGIATFVGQLAEIKIPTQEQIKVNWDGIEVIDSSLTSFAQGMNGVVNAVNALATPAKPTTLNSKLQLMTGVADFVKELAAIEIPVQTETLTKWAGFGESHEIDQSLTSFGQGMQAIVTAVNELNLGVDPFTLFAKYLQFEMVAEFVRQLAGIDIPTQFDGIEAFGGLYKSGTDSSLLTFAEGMGAVSAKLNEMSPVTAVSESDVKTMAKCVEYMANAAGNIKGWNTGIKALWEDNSLSKFAEEMKDAAEPITLASQGATGINLNNITRLADAVTAMVPVIEELTKEGTDYSNKLNVVSDYAGLVSNIGTSFSSFDGIQNVNVEDIKKIPEILEALREVSSGEEKLETNWMGNITNNPFENLISQVEALGDTSVNIQNITDIANALETLSSDSVAKFTSGFDDTSGTVKDAVDNLIQNAVTAITDSSTDTTEAFKTAGSSFLSALAEGMSDSSSVNTSASDSSGATALVTQIANSINSGENLNIIKQAGQTFVGNLAKGMSDTSGQNVDAGGAQSLVTEIVNSINSESNAKIFADAGRGFLESLATGMSDTSNVEADGGGAQALVDQVVQSLLANTDALASAGAELISSIHLGLVQKVPLMMNAGQQLTSGLSSGFTKNSSALTGSISKLVSNIHVGIIQKVSLMTNAGQQLTNALSSGFNKNTSAIVKAAGNVASRAKSAISSYQNSFYNIGVFMMNGLKNGIQSKANEIATSAANIVRNAINSAKSAGDINSPSKKMIQVGAAMDEGLAVGLKKYAKASDKAAAGVAQGTIDTVNKVLDIHSPSKVLLKSGKNAVRGFIYGVSKENKILTAKTKKQANKLLKQQLASDKDGQAARVAEQRQAIEKELKSGKKLGKARKKQLQSQLKGLKKLQKDYGTPTGNVGNTADEAITSTTNAIADFERTYRRSMTAAEKQQKWQELLPTLDPNSDQYKEVQNKIGDLNREIENERLDADEKWLNNDKEIHNRSVDQDIAYWQEKLAGYQQGSEAYNKIQEKIQSLSNDRLNEIIQNGTKEIENTERARMNSMSAAEKKQVWEKYLVQLPQGTKQYEEVQQKIADLNREIENEKLDADEKWLNNQKQLYDRSVTQDISYWQSKLKNYQQGSEAYNKIVEKIAELQNERYNEILENGNKRIEDTERSRMASMSAVEKQNVWKSILKQLPKGTKQYNEALKNINDLNKEIESERLEADEKWLANDSEIHNRSVAQDISYWQSKLRNYKKGSESYQKIAEKIASLNNERYNEILEKGNETIENTERARMASMTAIEKQNVWKSILKQLPKGTKQYSEALKNIESLNKEIESERLESFNNYLSNENERRDVSLAEEIKYWRSKQSQFKKGSDAYQKVADNITSVNNQIYKSIKNSEKSYQEGIQNTLKDLTKQIDNIWKQYEEDIKSRAKSLASTSGLFDFFESGTYESADTLLENLKSQVDGLDKFQSNMDALREKVNNSTISDKEAFLDQLEDLGPSANADLENLLDMTNKQWDEYVELYNKRLSTATSEARKDINISDYNKQVQEAIDSANESIKDLSKTYYDGITELGISIKEPSITVGGNMVDGMIKGIKDNEAALLKQVTSIANSTMNTAAKTLGIHSPSRKFAIFGKQIDLGLVQGLETYKYRVEDATAAVGEDSLQAMRDAIDYTSLIGDSDYNFNPVITPVLDDSLIAEGLDQMFGMINQRKVIQFAPNQEMMGLANSQTNQQIQNELFNDAFNRLAKLVVDSGGSIINNNEFNITSNDPREVANEVSRILNKQVQQKERTWA